jgi:hypothetical protein
MFDFTRDRSMRVLSLLGIAVLAVGLLACGEKPKITKEENMPEWFLNPPEDPNYVFGVQSATSQRMQVALDKASTSARGELATSLETKVESMTKSFTEEVGDDLRQQYTSAQKTVTSQVLRGTSPAEREVYQQDNGTYQAFVMMELPVGKAAKDLMSKLQQNEEMYTRFRASEAFEEMNKAVEEYEKEQQRGMAEERQEEGGGNK